MWILESRGDFFQGRRMWLKPGKQYLFGRVKKDGVRFALDHKTVSRKHFVISVEDVKEVDVGNTHARTVVTITDQGSKTGTLVNGHKAQEPRSLTQTENVIRLGTCQEELIVKWEPIVLTFNLLKKEIKAGLLKAKQDRLRELDIKVISDFIPGVSTYLIASKRNTAKGLQALIDGKHIVDESYIDALEYAATPSDLEEEENLSPLELDFDKAWPSPAEHLPPKGKEPTLRTDDSYRPNDARQNIFQKHTFVFADQTQYDNLLPPITMAHGKALLFPLVEKETTSTDLITYMRNAAGSKSFGDQGKETDEGAVVMVRWTSKTHPDWTNNLINEVALSLDQRAIEQSEFLDAILANDASPLRRSVPYESVQDDQIPPPSTDGSIKSNGIPDRPRSMPDVQLDMQQASIDADRVRSTGTSQPQTVPASAVKTDEENSPPAPSFRFSPRLRVQSHTFDDDFDEDAIIPFEEDESGNASSSLSPHQPDDHSDSGRASSPVPNGHESAKERLARKRARSATSGDLREIDNGNLDKFLPAATAMKRRKIAHDQQSKVESSANKSPRNGIFLSKSKSKKVKDLDIKEELRAQKEQERKKRETQNVGGAEDERPIEYDEHGKLMVYEVHTDFMELPQRQKPMGEGNLSNSDRWDPRWNGRKNFKNFRRARDIDDPEALVQRRRAHTRVIVPLMDAKKATYGVGEQYWERSEEDRQRDKERKKRASQRTTQNEHESFEQTASQRFQLSQSPERSEAENVEDVIEVDGGTSQVSSGLARLQQEAEKVLDGGLDVDQPRRTRADDVRPSSSSSTQIRTQTQTSTRTTRGVKRPGSTGRGAAIKKQRQLPIATTQTTGGDSDDSDDLKFKFGRGRRTRGRGKT